MKELLPEVAHDFQTKEQCYEYLEKIRWNGAPICPYCGSINNVKLKHENRYHCNEAGCKRTFSVLIGTIFEECRFPLPKYFMLIKLMLDARKGVSSAQLSRNLELSYKTAWYAAMRVRCAMVETITDLHGVIEADESYIGGKPRKRNNKAGNNVADLSNVTIEHIKRGRGTKKIPVVGFVERDGRVVTKVLENLTSQKLLGMLHKYVKEDRSKIMTDDYRGYRKFDEEVQHLIVTHSEKEYVRGNVHTNTIEGFWSIIKNGLRGQYHVLSRKYLPFYLAEWSYKYNRRNAKEIQFHAFMKDAVSESKCFNNYKPRREPNDIVYPKRNKPPKAELKTFNKANKAAGKDRKLKRKIAANKKSGAVVAKRRAGMPKGSKNKKK